MFGSITPCSFKFFVWIILLLVVHWQCICADANAKVSITSLQKNFEQLLVKFELTSSNKTSIKFKTGLLVTVWFIMVWVLRICECHTALYHFSSYKCWSSNQLCIYFNHLNSLKIKTKINCVKGNTDYVALDPQR